MQAYENGYADERFQHPVGHTFHCCICTNVIKDPVMCHNEHIFCRSCLTRHLMNSQTCPTCMEPLTVDTLSEAPRGIRNLLSELKINCEFAHRGCGKFIELGDLERHVRECGFAPAVCSNEGCRLEVNKYELLHHETSVCEQRRVKCHSCNDIRQEMDIVKVNLAAINVKLAQIDEKIDVNEKKFENVKIVVENVVNTKVELVQEQLNKQEESNRRIEADNAEIKKSLNEIVKQLEGMTRETPREVQAEQELMKKGIAEADGMNREPKVVIAGGEGLRSVEMFSLSNRTWTQLQPMKQARHTASSVVHNNQIFVIGGSVNYITTDSMEKLSINAVQAVQSIPWKNFAAELPGRLRGHSCIVYNGRLIVIGGFNADKGAGCDSITEVSLALPFIRKLLTTMPQTRLHLGVALFGDKIVILGGSKDATCGTSLSSVLLYDITKNECKELAPLPYPVSKMATVKWDDDNVIIMGGMDSRSRTLNKVFMYNVKTQKSHTLPNMKYKRQGCVAAVVRDTVIVMGGDIERGLKSVEGFRFDRNTWEELPEMHEARWFATAVVF